MVIPRKREVYQSSGKIIFHTEVRTPYICQATNTSSHQANIASTKSIIFVLIHTSLPLTNRIPPPPLIPSPQRRPIPNITRCLNPRSRIFQLPIRRMHRHDIKPGLHLFVLRHPSSLDFRVLVVQCAPYEQLTRLAASMLAVPVCTAGYIRLGRIASSRKMAYSVDTWGLRDDVWSLPFMVLGVGFRWLDELGAVILIRRRYAEEDMVKGVDSENISIFGFRTLLM
ncbi:hypothetical protein BDW02DRAFT_317632 [Decorospora gaudefroyi]|uniref:Uncharacterized protein n=1 Tax=Decorospora gaudefroyi TaxID=184978 RepID=A0A6A5KKL1_9PLEO|nr:hypothetical protein BDW02DRAFT_317632 [Decorospora gaudefroyi]